METEDREISYVKMDDFGQRVDVNFKLSELYSLMPPQLMFFFMLAAKKESQKIRELCYVYAKDKNPSIEEMVAFYEKLVKERDAEDKAFNKKWKEL
jgi:hypothetical protein